MQEEEDYKVLSGKIVVLDIFIRAITIKQSILFESRYICRRYHINKQSCK